VIISDTRKLKRDFYNCKEFILNRCELLRKKNLCSEFVPFDYKSLSKNDIEDILVCYDTDDFIKNHLNVEPDLVVLSHEQDFYKHFLNLGIPEFRFLSDFEKILRSLEK